MRSNRSVNARARAYKGHRWMRWVKKRAKIFIHQVKECNQLAHHSFGDFAQIPIAEGAEQCLQRGSGSLQTSWQQEGDSKHCKRTPCRDDPHLRVRQNISCLPVASHLGSAVEYFRSQLPHHCAVVGHFRGQLAYLGSVVGHVRSWLRQLRAVVGHFRRWLACVSSATGSFLTWLLWRGDARRQA